MIAKTGPAAAAAINSREKDSTDYSLEPFSFSSNSAEIGRYPERTVDDMTREFNYGGRQPSRRYRSRESHHRTRQTYHRTRD